MKNNWFYPWLLFSLIIFIMAPQCLPEQDRDGDGVSDKVDNCPDLFHLDQADDDQDGVGNACDSCPNGEDLVDRDGDGIDDCHDLCPLTPDGSNRDSDGDGRGDACDNCPNLVNAGQTDRDGDGVGNACDATPSGFSLEEATIASVQQAIHRGALRGYPKI